MATPLWLLPVDQYPAADGILRRRHNQRCGPVIVRASPRSGVLGNTVLTEGVARFAFVATENGASPGQSPTFALPVRFRSPTVSGKAGSASPPTVSAHTRASPMFTLRSALMSARSITFTNTVLDVPDEETAVDATPEPIHSSAEKD